MNKITNLASRALKNPAILYVISRYATYAVQFINSLFIALYLGPYYLGIWGFINLVLSYLAQLNLGIPHSINVIVSVNKDKEEYVQKVIGNGLSMIVGLSIIVILFFIISYISGFRIGDRYEFNSYLTPVIIIAVITHFNSLLSNVFRIYGKVFAIALNQSLFPIFTLILILFYRNSELLWAMVIANCFSLIISLLLFIVQTPIKLRPQFDSKLIKYIQKRGWYLFIYNTSFYLILLITKSYISGNYSVEEFGYFTFSYSLANAILLFLDALSYLVFPKMLHRFANSDNDHIQNILRNVRTTYISTSHVLIHFLIMIFPFIILIFPDYSSASDVFKVNALTIALYTNSFGYQALLIARGGEKKIAVIAFCALLLNFILVPIFINKLNIQFSYVMFATMIVYFIFVLALGKASSKELKHSAKFLVVIKDAFSFKMIIPIILSIGFIILSADDVYFTIPFIAYIILNYKELTKLKGLGLKMINNPNFINI